MRMKNKWEEQAATRQKHKDQLKAKKKGSSLERGVPYLTERPTILIVCEGENTEPSYFRQFRLTNATVKAVGVGYNTISLVERAIELSERDTYDQVWCVFDKDDFPAENFNEAIQLATRNRFKVAYSNQSFEYWLILHFNDHQGGALHRDDYHKKINDCIGPWGCSYDSKGSKIVSADLFDLLEAKDPIEKEERRLLACKRARRIYHLFDHSSPASEESSTTVFLLVEELAKYL